MTLKDLLELIRRNGSGILENSKGFDNASITSSLPIKEHAYWRPHWTITKYADEKAYKNGFSYEVLEIDGNMLLNSGINAIWNLVAGTGTVTAFNNSSAKLGVGDSITAATPTQTGLQATTNYAYVNQDVGYPVVNNQTISFKSTFSGSVANWTWQEVSVQSNGINLNRLVQNMGTKQSPAVWAITLNITLS